MVRAFVDTEQYQKLQRLSRVISGCGEEGVLGDLIVRYPYLYEYCLLSDDSSPEHWETVRHLRAQTQRRFEVDLSRYVVHQMRQAQVRPHPRPLPPPPPAPGQIIRVPPPPPPPPPAASRVSLVENPTLLSDREISLALTEYLGTERGATYEEIARQFLARASLLPTFRDFKRALYEYLIASVEPRYGQRQFYQRLSSKIARTLPQCDLQKPNEFLILRLSSQLLRFLVIESRNSPDHYVFMDLIGNIGAAETVGLLLRVVLQQSAVGHRHSRSTGRPSGGFGDANVYSSVPSAITCHKVKPDLERRFSILFDHYEMLPQEGVPWLVKSFENLHLAFAVHFGKVDLSFLKPTSPR